MSVVSRQAASNWKVWENISVGSTKVTTKSADASAETRWQNTASVYCNDSVRQLFKARSIVLFAIAEMFIKLGLT